VLALRPLSQVFLMSLDVPLEEVGIRCAKGGTWLQPRQWIGAVSCPRRLGSLSAPAPVLDMEPHFVCYNIYSYLLYA